MIALLLDGTGWLKKIALRVPDINISLLLIIASGVYLFLDKEILLEKHQPIKKRIHSWARIVVILAIAFLSFCNETQQDIQKQKVSQQDSVRYKGLKLKFDSLSNAFDTGLTNKSRRLTFDMTMGFIGGKMNDNSNTILLLTDALANKNELQHQIDSMNRKLDSLQDIKLPNLTYMDGDTTLVSKQRNDTLFFMFHFSNSGQSTAANIYCKAFFLFSLDGHFYEYKYPIFYEEGGEVPTGKALHNYISSTSSIPHFKLDSTNNHQYVLVIGKYINDNPKNIIEKDLCLCYAWNSTFKRWSIYNQSRVMKAIHENKDKSLKYFSTKR